MVEYAELHTHSHFSFLDGVNSPVELVRQAKALGLSALALTDHNGLYGVVPFLQEARAQGMMAVVGAELTISSTQVRTGSIDPADEHLMVLARGLSGYRVLSRLITEGQMASRRKGEVHYELEQIAQVSPQHLMILTGCRKGRLRRVLEPAPGRFDPHAAEGVLDDLVQLFGTGQVVVELTDEGGVHDGRRNQILSELASRAQLRTVVTGNVHCASPAQFRLTQAVSAIRANASLDEVAGWMPPAGRYLRSPAEMAARHPEHLEAVRYSAQIAAECALDAELLTPELPDFTVPPGYDDDEWLAELTYSGADTRYGSRQENPAPYVVIDHELELIRKLGFAGYFLIVHDIVAFCRSAEILCQGRGSAANSAVCYCLGITAVDAYKYELLFERFLSGARREPPDIDLDIESDRREEVIQYVYKKYGRDHAAFVANVITYRRRSALRDAGRVFGFDEQVVRVWGKQTDRDGSLEHVPAHVVDLAEQLHHMPRHLGVHSGGMVLCKGPVIETCPVEWATAADRSVLQWDKEDCADVGLVKFDLLGLGMLSALKYAFEWIQKLHGVKLDLHSIPDDDPAVYDLLCAADTVGVFQVESRAQMSTLPRLQPRNFYDIVVEVALIRPGPIQGGSVHPYINRSHDPELITYPHEILRPVLERTKGVPLFQEQLMQIAITAAGFSSDQADQLRRAMGSKRSDERMEALKSELYAGMRSSGIDQSICDQIYRQLRAFAEFGFPESHAFSFAYLVYASSWLKVHYPYAFYAGLLAAQPMGFYSPATLIADARAHHVQVLSPDVHASQVKASVEPVPVGFAVRLGLNQVSGISDASAERIVDERQRAPFESITDLAHRAGLSHNQLHQLSMADAFSGFGVNQREALWVSRQHRGNSAHGRFQQLPLPLAELGGQRAIFAELGALERVRSDLASTGVSSTGHPMGFLRARLQEQGIESVEEVINGEAQRRLWVAGVVTHRQRPGTARGVTFISLEDESGLLNVVCTPGMWKRHEQAVRMHNVLRIRGFSERADGATNLVAEVIEPLETALTWSSRDFR